MSLTVKREKQIKKEGVKRTKVPLIRIGVSDKPRPHNCQFEPIIIIIIIITLFQEDNIFGRVASLTYGPQLTNV